LPELEPVAFRLLNNFLARGLFCWQIKKDLGLKGRIGNKKCKLTPPFMDHTLDFDDTDDRLLLFYNKRDGHVAGDLNLMSRN
jgi:hypothetical protein